MSSHQPLVAPPTKANIKLLLLISLVCFILLAVLMVFSGNQQALAYGENTLLLKQNARVKVSKISVQSGYSKARTVFGQIESTQQSNLGFELSGMLAKVAVAEGENVVKGQSLARLDVSRLMAQQNELLSALTSAKANAKLAKLSEQRVKELVRNKLEPQQRLDEVDAQLDAANAAVSEAQARLDSIEVELNKSNLVAPFDGQVVTQFIDQGTVLSPGQAVFSILASEGLEARFGLPEQTAFGVQPGQVFNLNVNGSSVSATVKSIAKERQLATRTIEAILDINAQNLSAQQQTMLVSGDLVSLQVQIPAQKQGAWVPLSALASGVRGLWTLYVVNTNNEIETRIVSIEYAQDKRAYVSGAIANGDLVVVDGIGRLTPHQQVNNVIEVSVLDTVTPSATNR